MTKHEQLPYIAENQSFTPPPLQILCQTSDFGLFSQTFFSNTFHHAK